MKHIVSVSLGSSTRDHRVETEFLGEKYLIERIGINGDFDRMKTVISDLDGKVDALGLGGITMFFPCGRKIYRLRSAESLMQAARTTPIVDGTDLKMVLERQVIHDLDRQGLIPLKGKKVLLTVAFDRFSMAQAFHEIGCETLYGDLIFSFGVPLLLRNYKSFLRMARLLGPVACRLPFEWLYPTGTREEQVENPRIFARYYHMADVIAGDFLYIKRYLPDDITGRVIITNTVTSGDILDLTSRGATYLVTTTPNLGGRSFGTNVIQAVIVAALGKKPEAITSEEYTMMCQKLGFKPRVENLQEKAEKSKVAPDLENNRP